jgi:biotin carboxylase
MFPCILKPRFGFNSRSAVRVATRGELKAAYNEQQALYAALPKQDGTGSDFVVEELIPGSEHNVETLVKDGHPLFHLVSDKLPMTSPYFIEVGDNMPSSLCDSHQAVCTAVAERAIRLMGIRNGWTHTEVKLDGTRAIAVECAARMGGGYFETLFQEVYGLHRMQMLMLLFCSPDLPQKPAVQAFAAARRLVVYGSLGRRVLPAAAELFRPANVKLIWPEDPAAISRELAGPPIEFNNTLFEFVALGSSPASAQSVADNLLLQAQRNLVQH